MPRTQFTDAEVSTIVAEMDERGFAVLPDWVDRAQVAELQAYADATVVAAGNDYVALTGTQALSGSLLQQWGHSSELVGLCRRLVAAGTGRRATEGGFHQVMRCLTGAGGQRESMIFHYDSFVLTLVLPVRIPEGAQQGDLIMLPNRRPLRRTYLGNAWDKLLLDNGLTQRRLARRALGRGDSFVHVRMQPGNLYLFWGYRSVHTNLPCPPDAVRATAVFHYHDPHAGSPLAGGVRRLWARLRGRRPEPVAA
ncbi:hypothetical protein [Coralloluteibacterium stylophorae]|uniref:Uncharacterized protein n=1 Tax=Coralloluteibacterium stylophorae TaxID=1776034 RepID=A0A8J7VSH0_9GAMM|nr:hypothetical protein [Coralloluteibacterium stylophorae]MBS7457011.1 hypothetical protein [Coralloluteibacterium stylophorae]